MSVQSICCTLLSGTAPSCGVLSETPPPLAASVTLETVPVSSVVAD